MRRILALTAAAALLGAQGAQAEPVGFVAIANGDVQIGDGGAWQAASTDSEVEIGNTIRTGTGASAKIVLVDDTLLQIDEETELRIETFHIGDAATKDVSIVRQARGRLRTTVGDAFGGSTRLEVHVPTAAVGVKGTDFEVVLGTLWEACLLSGGITVRNGFGSADPAPGQCVYAYGDKAPGDPHPNPRNPLEVDGEQEFADRDFEEKIRVDVGAGPPGPDDSNEDNPWGGASGENREDEIGPVFDIPEPEIEEPQFDDDVCTNCGPIG